MPARTLPRFTRWTALELVCLALALLLASNGLSYAAVRAFVVFVIPRGAGPRRRVEGIEEPANK